jgi:hypothetical protein
LGGCVFLTILTSLLSLVPVNVAQKKFLKTGFSGMAIYLESVRLHPISPPSLTMSALKPFQEFPSKSPPEDSPNASFDATTETLMEEISPGTPTIADPDVPQYSDAMKEGWRAANAELPEARGVEKALNKIGRWLVSVYMEIVC